MPDVYSNIEVTDEEKGSLSQVEDKSSHSLNQPLTEPSSAENRVSQEVNEDKGDVSNSSIDSSMDDITKKPETIDDFLDGDYELQIGDDSYSLDTVLEWQKDSQNKDDWNKSNTQKAQAIAKGSRLLELLDNSAEFKDHVKEYFYEDEGDLKKYGLNGEYNIDYTEPELENDHIEVSDDVWEEDERIDGLMDRIENLEDEKLTHSIGDRFDNIKQTNPDFFQADNDGLDFLQFCNDGGVITNGDIDMDASFKLWSYDKVMSKNSQSEQLTTNRMRNQESRIGNSEMGAKEVRSGDSPKNYNDINMDSPEILRYFNS